MISNYNNVICNKMVDYIKSFLSKIESSYFEKTVSINLKKFVVIETNKFDINYLISHGLTGTYTLKLYFSVKMDDVETEFTEDLEIPKMINNIFVINGALRVPTNTLDNDNKISVYYQNIRINDIINITYEEDPTASDGYKLVLNIYDDEEQIVIDGTKENFIKYKQYLKLTSEEVDKLKVKLDTDYIDDVLSYDNVIALINLGPDKLADNMIDKKIFSAESNLMNYLNSRDIRRKVLTGMKSKFYQYNKIYLKDIQNAINRYFIIASEKNIDIPSVVNPLIFDAMRYKVVIPANVAYNETMTDIIDIANTPINANTNVINELNICTVIKDDVIYIKCYTYPDQVPVEVPYTHYCTKKVLLSQYWDYDLKQFKPGIKNLNYKLRLKLKSGTVNDKFDYIEPLPDDKLSITTRRIPLGNISDSVRVSMATSMHKQAVELQNSEPALVSGGHDDSDFEISTLLTRYSGESAVVDKIEDNKIFLKDKKTGSIQFYEIPSPTPSANDSIISFDSSVKVGQEITSGDVLVTPHMLKQKAFELGVNARAVYMNYLGYTHEDGIVISQTLADKMIHYSLIDVHCMVHPDDIIKYIRKVGSRVTSRDVLVNNQTKLRVNQALRDTYVGNTGLLSGMGISYTQVNLKVPNNIDEGYIISMDINILPDRPLTSEVSLKTIEEAKNSTISTDYEFLPKRFKELKANEVDIDDKASGYISFKILRVDRVKGGDKLANRYGSKGIVSLVLPDEVMPQIELANGERIPTEIILNPAAVISRKNISQLYECALTKCIEELYKRITINLSDGNIQECRNLLDKFSVVYKNKFSSLTDAEFVELHNKEGIYAYRMPVGFFSKVSYEQILAWLKLLQVSEYDKIYLPDIVIAETTLGLKGFPLATYVPSPGDTNKKSYELGYCEQPCITGKEYMMKLWKQANYDGKVTSEMLDTDEPIMGRGKYRFEGQKIGEMELWILIGSGIEKFIQEQSDTMRSSQYLFLNELLLSGYFIQDAQGSPLLSSARTRAKQLESLE